MRRILLLMFAVMMSIPTLFAGEVYFYFQDGEEDDFELSAPQMFVSIWNETADELVPVSDESSFMSYNVTGTTILRIYPSDLDFELVVSVDGNMDDYSLDKEDNEWYLTLFEDADGLEILVKVYLAGQAPGGSAVSDVSMNFMISAAEGSGINNPDDLLSISYFDRTTYQDVVVSLSDGYGSATVVPGTSFTISPAEGYQVTDILTFIEGLASISRPAKGDTEWYVAVNENPSTDFGSFFITLDLASGDDPGDTPSLSPVIKQIEDLQWTVTWEDFASISALDSEYDENYAYLTDAQGKKTILHANLHGYENPTIIFPDYGNYFTLNLNGLGLADGNYQLTIPAGYLLLHREGESNQTNMEHTLGLTIGGTPDVSYNVEISALSGNYFDITWENVTTLTEGNTTGAYLENVETGDRYDMYFLEDYMYSKANLMIQNNRVLHVNVTNNYPMLPTGTYKFYLPADYVKFNRTQTGNEAIEGYEFFYTRPWSEGRVEFNGPSDDNKITLTWIDASAVTYDVAYPGDGNSITGITIYDSSEYPVTVPYPDNISISGNALTIDLNDLSLVEGECRVMVPEGCLFITVDDETDYTDGVAFTFVYGEIPVTPGTELYSGPATWNIKSGDKVAGTLVEVGWGDFELSFVDDPEWASIHSFETGILYLEYGTEVYLSEDKSKILMDLGNMPDGVFRINVPEACVAFKVDGTDYLNQSTSMDNVTIDNTSGVKGFEAADGVYRVVDLNGMVILETTNASDLQKLNKGIYIVNGNKVLVSKH